MTHAGSESVESPKTSGMRILVLEDKAEWSEVVARVIRRKDPDAQVVQAFTLAQARQEIDRESFGLALVDLNVPDSHGLETLAAVRAAGPNMAIVVMTGEADERLGYQALRSGAQDYLVKGNLDTNNLIRTCRYATERFAAEMELVAAHQLLVRTLDGLPSCVAIMSIDGTIQAVNKAWTEFRDSGNPLICGCGVGTNYLELCDRHQDVTDGLQVIAQEILLGFTEDNPLRRMDYCVHTEEGSLWFELVMNHSTSGQGTSIVVSHLDISARKSLETRLRVSEELFSIISQNVLDLMAIIDATGRRLYTSPSYLRVLGHSEADMASHSAVDLLHPDDQARINASLQQLFLSGRTTSLEYRLRHKDGSWRYFDSNGALITNVASQVPQALIVARDVTERKQAESERLEMEIQLRQAQKLESIGQLAAGIAHEINTPTQFIGDNVVFLKTSIQEMFAGIRSLESQLRVALGQTSDSVGLKALENTMASLDLDYLEGEVPKAIEQSLDGVSRVTGIVSAMKEFSHPSSNQKEATDLNRAIESTITVSRNEWKYVAEMELDLDPALPLVPCYPGEFNQVILNLVVNAAHAIEGAIGGRDTGKLGRIRVATRLDLPWVRVTLTDSGEGIPEAIQSRIFDPFFTTKPVGKGTGQGLAIARSVIVDKHHGTIEVDSTPGVGTTFILHLPLSEVPHV